MRVGIGYMQGWNQDIGCVAWDGLMEDLATLEISRAQTWQWLHHNAELACGTKVTKALIHTVFEEELEKILAEVDENLSGKNDALANKLKKDFTQAAADAEAAFVKDELDDFLSLASDPA